jgi:multiple sugar transport system ATP-binding protein
MADRIVVMHDGHVQQHGAPLELYDNPANMFVAGFIGSPSMNFLNVILVEDGLQLPNGQIIPLTAPINGDKSVGRKLVLGMRPEHLLRSTEGAATIIYVVEPLGTETLVQVHFEGTPMTVLLKERIAASDGETLTLDLANAPQFLFDPETELRA